MSETPQDQPVITEKPAQVEKQVQAKPQQQKKEVIITPQDFQKIDIRVGKLTDVYAHPDSEKLYCEKIDIGEAEQRQIGSGLRQFIKLEDMTGLVLVMANLKKRKLAGFESNGMVVCASNEDHSQVEILRPPQNCKVGERVFLEGIEFSQETQPVMNPKHKITENCLPFCKTDDQCNATFQGIKFMTSQGPVTCQTLKMASIS